MELSERVQKVAKKELREDKFARDQCLQQMRDWLSKNEDVENVRIDDVFLLRFLRTKKFSVPMAQQLLLKYLNIRKIFPRMTTELDCFSSPVKEVFESGYLVVSPIRDQHGRRVIISRAEKFDPHIWNSSIQSRAYFLALETLLEDPENQVMGFTYVSDWYGASAAHLTILRPDDFEIFRHGEQSWPARHKEKFDPHIWNSSIQVRAYFLALETLLEDPGNQVMGFTYVSDWYGASAAHLTNLRPVDFEIFRHGQQSWPARHKAFHFINVPSTLKWVFGICRRLMSNKITDRFSVYSSWREYNTKYDSSCLPKELGSTIPMVEMVQWWMQEMADKRDIIVQLDKMKLLSDRGITKKNEKDMSPLHAEIRAHMDSVAGSFRKLEVD